MGFDTTNTTMRRLWTVARPATVPVRQFSAFLLLITWMLWKERNAHVFRQIIPSHTQFWLSCREEARLWSARFRQEERVVIEAWCSLFSSM
ncbi:hypothetical protein SEVIR_7G328850v4 [Setaria viridis]|uniref:Uncharacterized protein n=1 Tax=Setaria viridis TaxID=4556 RepID=A0A4U6U158_SETVI|nr:hypothetical protein SEVIR_7G328850v2 [Setaria viridis]